MPLLFFNTNDAACISVGIHEKADAPLQKKAENTEKSQKRSLVFESISKLKYLARDSPLTYTISRVDDPGQDSLERGKVGCCEKCFAFSVLP